MHCVDLIHFYVTIQPIPGGYMCRKARAAANLITLFYERSVCELMLFYCFVVAKLSRWMSRYGNSYL